MTGFRFENLLWLLLLIPMVVLGFAAIRRRRSAAILYSDVSLLLSLPPTITARLKRLVPWLRILGLALLIVALARPQRGVEEMRVRTEGIAIQMCLDRSGSMAEEDFTLDGRRVDRLTAVKSVFRDFVQGKGNLEGRPDDLVGVIAFAGYPDSKCPLTLDHGAVLQVLETIEIAELNQSLAGRQLNRTMPRELQQRLIEALNEEKSTAIGDALVLAVDRIKDIDAKSKVIVLLSDGRNNAGQATPQEAAEAAKAFGIKVYTIGVGSTEGATRDLDIFGLPRWRPTMSDLDEETLKAVADTTGGRYFHAADTEALVTVYAEIDKLEKTVTEGWPYTQHHELCFWPMLAGLGLIVTQIVLVCTRFRSLP